MNTYYMVHINVEVTESYWGLWKYKIFFHVKIDPSTPRDTRFDDHCSRLNYAL